MAWRYNIRNSRLPSNVEEKCRDTCVLYCMGNTIWEYALRTRLGLLLFWTLFVCDCYICSELQRKLALPLHKCACGIGKNPKWVHCNLIFRIGSKLTFKLTFNSSPTQQHLIHSPCFVCCIYIGTYTKHSAHTQLLTVYFWCGFKHSSGISRDIACDSTSLSYTNKPAYPKTVYTTSMNFLFTARHRH